MKNYFHRLFEQIRYHTRYSWDRHPAWRRLFIRIVRRTLIRGRALCSSRFASRGKINEPRGFAFLHRTAAIHELTFLGSSYTEAHNGQTPS